MGLNQNKNLNLKIFLKFLQDFNKTQIGKYIDHIRIKKYEI